MDTNDLLSYAIGEIENIKVGEKILLKDLFKGYEWNRIARKDRLLLGTLFLNSVNNNQIKNLSTYTKSASGQQQYVRID
ncbi:MAG: single-stranded DNA-binding protein [Eubacteriales bacterium]